MQSHYVGVRNKKGVIGLFKIHDVQSWQEAQEFVKKNVADINPILVSVKPYKVNEVKE